MSLNILFITADQWRADCLSAVGHPIVRTPNLDALAAEGVLFEKHFANAVPCGPSRASLHTGMFLQNHRSGTNGTPLESRHTNWAKEAAATGYDPVLFGYTDTSLDPRELEKEDPWLKTYEGPLPGIRPLVIMGETPYPWTNWLKANGFPVPEPISRAYGARPDGPEYEDGAPAPRPLAYPEAFDEPNYLVDRCIEYIRAADTPFIAHLSILRPHPPFVAPEPYNAMYDPLAVPGFSRLATPDQEASQHPWLAYQLSRRQFRASADERKMRRLKAVYFGLMSEVDAALGRLFEFLKRSRRWDDTLIIFTSDHGEQMGDHWLLGKCGYFDASYHIPLIVRDPRQRAHATRGSRVRSFTENVDIMPTMLNAIGCPVPLQCDGRPLAPFLEGSGTPSNWRTEAHWEFDFRDPTDAAVEVKLGLTLHQCTMNVIRDSAYKYVHFTKLPPLLFDLRKDPDEFVNCANDPDYLPVMLQYAQKLLSWRMNHDEHALTHIALTHEGPVERPAPRY